MNLTIDSLAKLDSKEKRSLVDHLLKKKLDEPNVFPLSYFQQRSWLVDQIDPNRSLIGPAYSCRVKGPLNSISYFQSVNGVIFRHHSLRTGFLTIDGIVVQRVMEDSARSAAFVDLSALALSDQDSAIDGMIRTQRRHPFNAESGPLLRVSLIRVGRDDHVIVINLHNLISDDQSARLFRRCLNVFYEAFTGGLAVELAPVWLQYSDFAIWQRHALAGRYYDQHIAYWTKQLHDLPACLDYPTDHPRPSVGNYESSRITMTVSESLIRSLKTLIDGEGQELFLTLLSVFKILLYRHSGQGDIVVGILSPRPDSSHIQDVIGNFTNCLAIRTYFSDDLSFKDVLDNVRRLVADAYAHKDVPFEKLIDKLNPPRNFGHAPIFQVLFSLLKPDDPEPGLGDMDVEELPIDDYYTNYDLILLGKEVDGSLELSLVYNRYLFSQGRMLDTLEQLKVLLSQVAVNPDAAILSCSLRTTSALEKISKTVDPQEIHELNPVHVVFSRQAILTAEKYAVITNRVKLTYRELDWLSSQIANFLISNGIRSEEIVVIFGQRCADLVCAMLGVLKAGAAFAIMDSSYPAPRLSDFVNVINPAAWIQIGPAGPLTRIVEKYFRTLTMRCNLSLPLIESDGEYEPLKEYSTINPEVGTAIDQLAYVSYVPGTDGQPDAVSGTHRPLAYFISWHCQTFQLLPTDRFCILSGLSHDPLLREVFTPLFLGATLYIPGPDNTSPNRLRRWLLEYQITVAHLTPAAGQLLAEAITHPRESYRPLESLRLVFFSGGRLSRGHIKIFRFFAPECLCINYYGSTETQQAVGYHIITDDEISAAENASDGDNIPLGRGIAGVEIMVLNNAGEKCGIGEFGEIHVLSAHLSRGYFRNDELTQSRFFVNPSISDDGRKLYRTGDWGRYRVDGNIEFVRRLDNRVKIRGFRVELEDLELTLCHYHGITDAAIIISDSVLTANQDPEQPRFTAKTEYLSGQRKTVSPEVDLLSTGMAQDDEVLVAFVVANRGSDRQRPGYSGRNEGKDDSIGVGYDDDSEKNDELDFLRRRTLETISSYRPATRRRDLHSTAEIIRKDQAANESQGYSALADIAAKDQLEAGGHNETKKSPVKRISTLGRSHVENRNLPHDLRRFLLERLPEYMVPVSFLIIDKLPRLGDGRIDRDALKMMITQRDHGLDPLIKPRYALEVELTKIWERVLGRKNIGVRDKFFDMGGYSLLAVTLFEQIDKFLGKKLPLATIFESPTIEELATVIQKKGWSSPWSSLLPIYTEGFKSPFFCIHDALGTVSIYRFLAHRLDPDRPVYGLQACGLDEGTSPLASVEKMAGRYIREIRYLQPQGPYYLGGRGLGGRIAFEMAHQLQEDGHEIAMLALFDSVAMGYMQHLPRSKQVQFKVNRLLKLSKHHISSLLLRSPEHSLEHILQEFHALKMRFTSFFWRRLHASAIKAGSDLPRGLENVIEACRAAGKTYKLTPRPLSVTLFRVRKRAVGGYEDPFLGWRRFATEGVKSYEVPGSYATILDEPAVSNLAEKLRMCIEEAEERLSGGPADIDVLDRPRTSVSKFVI